MDGRWRLAGAAGEFYDAESHLTQSTAGNAVKTSKVYNANTGGIQTIKSGPGDSVQDLGLDFNTLGNLIERIWAMQRTQASLMKPGVFAGFFANLAADIEILIAGSCAGKAVQPR